MPQSIAPPLGCDAHTVFIILAAIVLATVAWLSRRKWPVITVMLYAVWVVLFLSPLVGSIIIRLTQPRLQHEEIWRFIFGGYDVVSQFWLFWILSFVAILSQALLLILPVAIVKRRPTPQRSFRATATAAAGLLAILIFFGVWSITAALFKDHSLEGGYWFALGFLPASWIVWGFIFGAFVRGPDPRSYLRRLIKWVLRGSILELLIAVPSHVIVRHRDTCCADYVTAAGIAAGLAVMLISFGPGIYFLYAEKIESKKQK